MRLVSLLVLIFLSVQASANSQYGHAPWVGEDLTGAPCRGGQGVGPLDYTSPNHRQSHLYRMVVGAHFNDRVRSLKGGKRLNNPDPWGDLDYTLRGIPNHHAALYSMMNYQQDKANQNNLARNGSPSTACYLKRAINFAPDDYVSRMLLGIHYAKKNLHDEALRQYKEVEQLAPDNAGLHYNMGLLYLDMKNSEKALIHAKKAYENGYPLQGLKKKLVKSGVWKQ